MPGLKVPNCFHMDFGRKFHVQIMMSTLSNPQGICESLDAHIVCFVLDNKMGLADGSKGNLLPFSNNSNMPIEQNVLSALDLLTFPLSQ